MLPFREYPPKQALRTVNRIEQTSQDFIYLFIIIYVIIFIMAWALPDEYNESGKPSKLSFKGFVIIIITKAYPIA
jgi:hypothetical protein